MHLNPCSRQQLNPDVELIEQDCLARWLRLDAVSISNFFEHLPHKLALREAARCLRLDGRIVALGSNIGFVQGACWDFWDYFLCLIELSLGEALEDDGYSMVGRIPRFLPYRAVNAPGYPTDSVRLCPALPFFSRSFGRQFLVVTESN
jgi:hypothetical protein